LSPEEAATYVRFDGRIGLTERLAWRLGTLGFAYTFANGDGTEIVPYGGLLGWNDGYRGSVVLGAGAAVRLAFGRHSFVGTAGADWKGVVEHSAVTAWSDRRVHASIGYGLAVGDLGAVHVGLMALRTIPDRDYWGDRIAQNLLLVGSVQELGLASLPLVRVRLPSAWCLDMHAAAIVAAGQLAAVTYGASVLKMF